MRFDEFERVVREAFEQIPAEYREGIDGLVVSREVERHPTLPEIYTLGYCDTESYPSDWVGPETTRSTIVLYHGSFRRLARLDPDFDWEAEIYETVEHEVRHHLEWLAAEDQLGGVDYAMDESFKRAEGLAWDPWYWQHGEPAGGGAYVVEDRVYIERPVPAGAGEDAIRFRWRGATYEIDLPDDPGDLHFVRITDGVESAPAALEVVLVRERSWWEDVKRIFGSSRPRVVESEAEARRIDDGDGGRKEPPPPDGGAPQAGGPDEGAPEKGAPENGSLHEGASENRGRGPG